MKLLLRFSLALVLLVSFTSTASCGLFDEKDETYIQLYRRSTAGGYTYVKPGDLASFSPSSAGATARHAQLNYIGELGTRRNVTQWIDYYNSISATAFSGSSPQAIAQSNATSGPFAPVIRVALIAVIMMILSPLVCCCFCCCRVCKKCGGRQPSSEGYSNEKILQHIGAFLAFGIVTIAMVSLLYAFASNVTQVPVVARKGALALFDSADEFLENTKGGVSASPDAVFAVTNTVVNKLLYVTFPSILNQTFDGVVDTLTNDLLTLSSDIAQGKALFTDSIRTVNAIKNHTLQIPGILASISAQIVSLSSFSVVTPFQNATYNIGNLPDLAPITTIQMPNLTSIPNLSSYLDSINNVPDLAALALSTRGMYQNVSRDLPNTVNKTLNDAIGSPQTQITTQLSSINSTISGVQTSVQLYRAQAVDKLSDSTITTYSSYLDDVFMVEAILVIVSIVLSLFGILAKRRRLMDCFTCVMAFIPILLWLEFMIFYFLALPFNVVCNSADTAIHGDYNVSALTGATLSGQALVINPGLFLDGCSSGNSVFNSSVNANGDTLITFIQDFSQSLQNSSGLSNALDTKQLKSMINIGNFTDQTKSLQNISLSSFNASSLSIPLITVNFSSVSIVQSMNTTVYNLRPVDFDPQGNYTVMMQKIAQFNSDTTVAVPTFSSWNYSYISFNYAQSNSSTFNPVTITQQPTNSSLNNQVNVYFYTMFPNVVFYYQCSLMLAIQRQKTDTLTATIVGLQTNQINVIQADIALLQSSVANVSTFVNSTLVDVNVLVSHLLLVQNATDTFINLVVAQANSLVSTTVTLIINAVLVNNPSSAFGQCEHIADSIDYTKDVVCTGLVNALSGVWFCAMLTAIFMVPTWIMGVRTKKRIEYLELKNKVGYIDGKKKGFDQPDVLEGGSEVNDILQSAPITDSNDEQDPNSQQEQFYVGGDQQSGGVDGNAPSYDQNGQQGYDTQPVYDQKSTGQNYNLQGQDINLGHAVVDFSEPGYDPNYSQQGYDQNGGQMNNDQQY